MYNLKGTYVTDKRKNLGGGGGGGLIRWHLGVLPNNMYIVQGNMHGGGWLFSSVLCWMPNDEIPSY